MALISLDDLEGLDDEQLDDITDNPEPMGEDNSEQLLAHWQAVASTHQVSVPTEMTSPIQEMTRNRQLREQLPFTSISRHEKMGELLYEEREYPAGYWATVTQGEELYEQSISYGFMKLMRFICKENSAGRYLGMTIPVLSDVHLKEDGVTFDRDVQTSFFLPAEFQNNSLQPLDSVGDITVVYRESFRVVARTFLGTTTEETISNEICQLWEILGNVGDILPNYFMLAVYENPGVPQRRNEIWFIRRQP